MEKYTPRNVQKGGDRYKLLQDKSVKRFQQNATRLERFKGKNKKNKG